MLQARKARWADTAASLLWLSSLTVLLYGAEQSAFAMIIVPFGLAFAAYVYLLRVGERLSIQWIRTLAIVASIIAVPAFPNLSDDVYRFIWDGRLLVQGQNPFEHLPAHYLSFDQPLRGITTQLYDQLNSPAYFTVYPPVAQAVFALGAGLFPDALLGHTIVIKLFLLACTLGAVAILPRLLSRLHIPIHRSAIYLLNPLVVVEVMGNLHFEGAVVFFLLLALWGLSSGRWRYSAVAMALSVGSKLLPLLFFPFLIRSLGWRRSMAYFLIVGLILALLFAPLFSMAFVEGFSSSLDLYFRRFEFNASVYYLMRWVGYQLTGYNEIALIGPLLAACTFTGIIAAALFNIGAALRANGNSSTTFGIPALSFLFAITLYLLLTPTVHPWYVCLPLSLCLFTNYRYPVLWSGLVMLTYINYSYAPYWENLWVVAIEYILLFSFMAWEYSTKKKTPTARVVLDGAGSGEL